MLQQPAQVAVLLTGTGSIPFRITLSAGVSAKPPFDGHGTLPDGHSLCFGLPSISEPLKFIA